MPTKVGGYAKNLTSVVIKNGESRSPQCGGLGFESRAICLRFWLRSDMVVGKEKSCPAEVTHKIVTLRVKCSAKLLL